MGRANKTSSYITSNSRVKRKKKEKRKPNAAIGRFWPMIDEEFSVYVSASKHSGKRNHEPNRQPSTALYKQPRPQRLGGCEGDLAATSVTPLIARVDSADLAG